MEWGEYADATSHAAIWIGVTADGIAAEIVETGDGWRWRVWQIGAESRGVIAHGRRPTADDARREAEIIASSERCTACGAPLEQIELADGSAAHVCSSSWTCLQNVHADGGRLAGRT